MEITMEELRQLLENSLNDELLQKYLEESREFWDGKSYPATIVGSTVGVHAGPGAVAVAYFAK